MPICRIPEAVEHVKPVDLVLDRRRRLEPEHQADRAGLRCAASMSATVLITVKPVGMRQVSLPHAEIGDDVVPAPRRVTGDARGAVHQVVEDHCQAGGPHPRVGGVLPAGAVVGRRLAHVCREPDRVVVQADDQAVAQQRGRAGCLLGGQARVRRRQAPGRTPA